MREPGPDDAEQPDWTRLRASALVDFTAVDRDAIRRLAALLQAAEDPEAAPDPGSFERELAALHQELLYIQGYLEFLARQRTETRLTPGEIELSRLAERLAAELGQGIRALG